MPTSNIKTPLLPHQQRGLDKLRASHGLLAHWGTGSGKGLEALSAIDEFGDPAEVITPAGLVANFEKEQHKHLISIYSFNKNGEFKTTYYVKTTKFLFKR